MAKATANYLGKVPAMGRRRPPGLHGSVAAALGSGRRAGKPKASKASSVRVNPRLASSGTGRPPNGGGGGVPKVTSPMATAPRKTINKPKTGSPGNRRRLSKPRADGVSKI